MRDNENGAPSGAPMLLRTQRWHRERCRKSSRTAGLAGTFVLNDLPTTVDATAMTRLMRQRQFAATWAGDELGHGKCLMAASLVATLLADLPLGVCAHVSSPRCRTMDDTGKAWPAASPTVSLVSRSPVAPKQVAKVREAPVGDLGFACTRSVVQIVPTSYAQPRAVGCAERVHWHGDHQFLANRLGKIKFVIMVNPEGHVVVGHAQCRSGHDVNRGEVFGIEVDRQRRDGILKTAAAVENDLGRGSHAREDASRAPQEADRPDERRQRTSFRHHRGDRRGRRTDDVVAGEIGRAHV